MVPTFAKLEEPNIAAIWKEEDTAIVSHGPRPSLPVVTNENQVSSHPHHTREDRLSRLRSGTNLHYYHEPLGTT